MLSPCTPWLIGLQFLGGSDGGFASLNPPEDFDVTLVIIKIPEQLVILIFLCYLFCVNQALKKIIEYLSHEKPIIAVYLFGSTAKGMATEKSDIDIGILLKEDFDLIVNYNYKLRLMGELKDLSCREVDIVFIDRVDPILQYHIRKYGKVIFERDRHKRIAYEIKARKDYFDFLPRHKKYMERMQRSY